MSENSFPVTSELYEDESGLGFCLRAAASNGVALAALRRLLDIGPSARITAAHAPRLAQWCGVEKNNLEQRLPTFLLRANGARRLCYGHLFRQPGALRLLQPQLCPQCISESEYLRDIWDLTLATCCLRHRRVLTGRCLECNLAIKWDRKGIQWGTCRHHLGASGKSAEADLNIVNAQRILQASFRSLECQSIVKEMGLPVWLSGLSVDGWTQVFYAFGLLKNAWNSLSSKDLSQSLPPDHAQQVVGLGFRRLQDYGGSTVVGAKKLASVVARAPIMNLMLCPTGLQDQAIGRHLFLQIYEQDEFDSVVRRFPQLGQRDLFGTLAI